jgi:hypothetical protein
MRVNALSQGAPWPPRRVAAPSAPAPLPEPHSDEERAAIVADDELMLDVQRREELQAAYRTGERHGRRRGVREVQHRSWWAGFVFGITVGGSLIVVLIKLGQAAG